MIADNVPVIAQPARLGHTLDDKIQQVYSRIAHDVKHRLLQALQDRWAKAAGRLGRPRGSLAWRQH